MTTAVKIEAYAHVIKTPAKKSPATVAADAPPPPAEDRGAQSEIDEMISRIDQHAQRAGGNEIAPIQFRAAAADDDFVPHGTRSKFRTDKNTDGERGQNSDQAHSAAETAIEYAQCGYFVSRRTQGICLIQAADQRDGGVDDKTREKNLAFQSAVQRRTKKSDHFAPPTRLMKYPSRSSSRSLTFKRSIEPSVKAAARSEILTSQYSSASVSEKIL